MVRPSKIWRRMSALGQKQTCAAQLAMSVYPQKRTFAVLRYGPKADFACASNFDYLLSDPLGSRLCVCDSLVSARVIALRTSHVTPTRQIR